MRKLIVLRGAPGCGKSTIAKKLRNFHKVIEENPYRGAEILDTERLSLEESVEKLKQVLNENT